MSANFVRIALVAFTLVYSATITDANYEYYDPG
jgi:hypothetical protein